MQTDGNILELLMGKSAQAVRRAQRAVILQPGAIGDCILTLPLAEFLKDSLALGAVDILGHTEYIGILPGRTCVDGIRSVDSVDLHRLFVDTKQFNPADRDPLISFFADYNWIVSFLGEPNSNFEQNLIFTTNCSHSAEVITLPMKAPEKFSDHISEFYAKQFIDQCGLSLTPPQFRPEKTLIRATDSDAKAAQELLKQAGLNSCENPVILHPGSGGRDKCWHLDNFLATTKKLVSKGLEVIFLLGPAELERFDRAANKNIRSVAKCLTNLSLAEVLGLLSCSRCFVGNDSGITHLAAALGVKTAAVFGPSDAAVYRPIGPDVKVFTCSSPTFADEPSPALQHELLEFLAGVCNK